MNYGTINKGKVSKTEGQVKKHRIQMDENEKEFLKGKLNNLKQDKLVISQHLEYKFIGYDMSVVSELPFRDNVKDLIIEYNETPMDNFTDRRVLLRSIESYKVNIKGKIQNCNICVVYSLVTNRIVTVYWNLVNDNHRSINWNRYSRDLKIIY